MSKGAGQCRTLSPSDAVQLAAGPGRTATSESAPLAQSAMTNQDVIALKRAGFSDDIVTETIGASPAVAFGVGTSDLIALRGAGISEAVIKVMIRARSK
jgi:hypothetical protein